MSNYEETLIEKEIRKQSEEKNPYAEQCPNRHLWSEGFRMGSKLKEKDLHDYNKWLTEVWSSNWVNIPFMKDAPSAYLRYVNKKP